MDNLLKILLVLGVALFATVWLLERIGSPVNEKQASSIGRWILPLCALLAVAQLLRYWLG